MVQGLLVKYEFCSGVYLVDTAGGVVVIAVVGFFQGADHYTAIGGRVHKFIVFQVDAYVEDRLLGTAAEEHQVTGLNAVFFDALHVAEHGAGTAAQVDAVYFAENAGNKAGAIGASFRAAAVAVRSANPVGYRFDKFFVFVVVEAQAKRLGVVFVKEGVFVGCGCFQLHGFGHVFAGVDGVRADGCCSCRLSICRGYFVEVGEKERRDGKYAQYYCFYHRV